MESARNLRYFLAVADSGSVTGAAQELGIAQPARSQAITRMERELDVKLFERTRCGVALTTAGAAIVNDVRLGVARIDAAEKRARDIGATWRQIDKSWGGSRRGPLVLSVAAPFYLG